MQEKKWGICLDCETYNIGLFYKVVQYQEDDERDEVIIILPITAQVSKKNIKELSESPKYIYGEKVFPCNHPSMKGVILEIQWHFKLKCYIYIIEINGKRKSKRYFDDDLKRIE